MHAVALLLVAGVDGVAVAADAGLRVLFVGNSLTDVSDVPNIAADLAYRWKSSGAMTRPDAQGRTEFNPGILAAIGEDHPSTPDAARGKELLATRTRKGEKPKDDSDYAPGAQPQPR